MFNKELLNSIGEYLLKKKETIAVAESVTAGLGQFAFSTIPDASRFFQGGITTYNVAQKFKHLQVEPIHAIAVNCVSEKVAAEMASNVCALFSSDWGIGITGYATPVPESGNKIFAFYAINHKDKIKASGKILPVGSAPIALQEEYVSRVLSELSAQF